jgi:hypothetical protein
MLRFVLIILRQDSCPTGYSPKAPNGPRRPTQVPQKCCDPGMEEEIVVLEEVEHESSFSGGGASGVAGAGL